jgi:hypothetical protein
MPFVLNSNSAAGFLKLNAPSGGGYTPNYPSGLSYTTGLIGWYDSSQPSSIVKDGSNNVSQWNNLFNGATQGATVLPAFTIPAGNSAPTFVTNQSYVYGTLTGSKNGILFDGVTSLMNLTNLGSLLNLKNFAVFATIKQISVSTGGNNISIVDQQTSNADILGLQLGYNGSTNSTLTLSDAAGQSINNNTPTIDNNKYTFGFQSASTGGNNFTGFLFENSYSSIGNSFGRYVDNSTGPADMPWDSLVLGGDVGPASTSLIGEILVYNITSIQQGTNYANIKTIMNYLTNKWA